MLPALFRAVRDENGTLRTSIARWIVPTSPAGGPSRRESIRDLPPTLGAMIPSGSSPAVAEGLSVVALYVVVVLYAALVTLALAKQAGAAHSRQRDGSRDEGPV